MRPQDGSSPGGRKDGPESDAGNMGGAARFGANADSHSGALCPKTTVRHSGEKGSWGLGEEEGWKAGGV